MVSASRQVPHVERIPRHRRQLGEGVVRSRGGVLSSPLFVLGSVSGLFSFVTMVGGAFSSSATGLQTPSSIACLLPFPIAIYLVFESGIRLGAAFLQARPIGSVPGTLLYEIYRAFRGSAGVATLSSTGLPASPERMLCDRFRMVEPLLALLPPEEQEVFERRFDMDMLHWGKVTAVLETGELMKGGGPASSRKSLV